MISALRGQAGAILAICLLLPCLVLPAAAQQRVEHRSILEMFFGSHPSEQPETDQRYERPPRPRKHAAPRPQAASDTSDDKPAPAAKLDTAKTILVVGDFLASGLGSGLEDAFANSPGVTVQTRGTIASGLVRPDYYDWPSKLPQMMDSLKPAAVVVMIGANDRQQMTAPGLDEKFGTDIWFLAYEERVQTFAKLITARHIPLVWIGLTPFGTDSATADSLRLNQLYKSQVESVGGEYVDIWDGFTDEDGKFIVTGSDVDGQQVRLRTADGINMTTAGRRKMAFYAEKPLRRLLGDQASPDITRLDTDKPADASASASANPADESAKTVPIGLSDPDPAGGSALLGDAPAASGTTPSPRDLLVEKGQVAQAPAGRVDDFRLPAAATPVNQTYKGPR